MAGNDDERSARVDPATLQQLLGELAEARKEIRTLAAMLGSQRPPAPPEAHATTIAELYASYEKIRRADHSWVTIRNRLRPLVKRLGKIDAAALTPGVWAEHFAARKLQPTARDKPPADHTLNLELGRAKEMLDYGVRAGLVAANALRSAKKVKTISARETFLTEPQIQQLLTGVSDLPSMHAQIVTRAFILCALDGLMRFNEVRTLRRDRIGKDGRVELSAKTTKSRKRRVVCLTPRALQAIAEIPPVLGTHQVFANPSTGRLYGISSMRAWFRVACIASGVDAFAADGERVVVHSLRHSGATAADARGASPMAIKEAMGHASIATTEKYLHRHREESARNLAKLMADGAEAERRGPHASPNVPDVGQNLIRKK